MATSEASQRAALGLNPDRGLSRRGFLLAGWGMFIDRKSVV